jgi:hypothetical protein
VNQLGDFGVYETKWKSAKNGRIYQPYFRFHYKEVNKTTLDTTSKYVDWYLSSLESSSLDGGEDMITSYNGESFFKNLQAHIPVDPNIDRVIGKTDYVIAVGGDELSIYMDLNKPSTTIIQERPAYTNVSSVGMTDVGIFSCRYLKIYSYNLTSFTRDKLFSSDYTSQLGFK